MASNNLATHRKLIIIGVALLLLATPMQAFAQSNPAEWDTTETRTVLPNYFSFIKSVKNGQTGVLRGIYVSDVLALPIIQQPVRHPEFVSENYGEITQFNMATQMGNVGLLAHNHLSGEAFFNLLPGQEVRLIYGDGRVESFIISQILRYQALDPYNENSTFRNLETNTLITAEELFYKMYRGNRHITFQTCIEANGDASWGRLFIIAEPKISASNMQ